MCCTWWGPGLQETERANGAPVSTPLFPDCGGNVSRCLIPCPAPHHIHDGPYLHTMIQNKAFLPELLPSGTLSFWAHTQHIQAPKPSSENWISKCLLSGTTFSHEYMRNAILYFKTRVALYKMWSLKMILPPLLEAGNLAWPLVSGAATWHALEEEGDKKTRL